VAGYPSLMGNSLLAVDGQKSRQGY